MRALQLFAAVEGEASVVAPNIFLVNQPSLNEEEVGIGTDAESEEEDNNEPVLSDYDSEELKFFRKEKHGEVNDQLDMFLELEKGMCFKNLKEAKRVVNFYSIANKKGLQVDKSDTTRLRYMCDVGCPFECLISEDKKNQGFKIKTLNTNHTCLSAFQNRRATQDALAHYFKKKIQNNPKYKGSYIDEFNKLKAYAQELRESNPATDVIINISKEALNQGKRRYEVVKNEDTPVVHLGRKKCTCRTWDLTGIPCPHSIKAYIQDKQEPEDHVNWWSCIRYNLLETKSVGPELHITPLSIAVVDTDGDESQEDEQPTMQPKRISKAKTRLEAKKVPHRPTGTRKIGFKSDENGAHRFAPEIPEDLYHLIKKVVAIRKHLERNRKDKDSKFRLILVENRIHCLTRYYKKTKKLPPVWKYESTTASTLVA
ncbi:40S ribosomal protein S13 [Capsicum chinense]|nr:40S ribosomal protein S13 [Capsicum chinense]